MMKITIAAFVLIAVTVVHSQNDGEFKIDYYSGRQQDRVIKVHYKSRKSDWPRQPYFCYGAIINWKQIIVPCSCVAYTNDRDMASAWNQAYHSTSVRAISPSDIMVGLMSNEHSDKEKTDQVGVQSIQLHPKCDATFQVDFALLVLQRKVEKSRLSWVNSPHRDELKKQIAAVSIASALNENCRILRWSESISEQGGSPKWEIQQSTVQFQHWHMCLPLVCPEFMKDGKTGYRPQNQKECFNKVEGSRYCLTWTQETPLCNVVPGTPVFCNMGTLKGIMGIMTNFTTHCEYSFFFNGVMAAFDDAMEIASNHLRVRNSEYYSKLRIKESKPKPQLDTLY